MGWRVSKEEDFYAKDFDLWWADTGIDGKTLQDLKIYQKMFMLDWDLKDILNSRHSPSK